jgi:DNA-binding transcriptional LysR family regulator
MDLRQLKYFVAVSEERGVRAAARRLYISQPQISQALLRLETELGVELMRRSTRGIELTPEGHELLRHSKDILERVDNARAALRRVSGQRSSTLRVGVLAGVLGAGELLAPILDTYRQAHPEVALHLSELSFNEQVTRLIDDSIDAAIVRAPLSHPEINLTPIAEEPRVVMVGVNHELAGAERVDVEDLLHLPTLPLDAPTDWADYWQLNDCRGGANSDQNVPPVPNVPAAQFALASHNLLITSPATIGRLAANPLVRVIELTGAKPSVIAVARRRRDTRTAVRQFVEEARITAQRDILLLPGGTVPD